MNKKLLQSKKAKQSWIGALVVASVGLLGDYLGVDPDVLSTVIFAITAKFGVAIGGQALQDRAIAAAEGQSSEPDTDFIDGEDEN